MNEVCASGNRPSSLLSLYCRYLYYFENDNPAIQVRYISGLVALINEQNTGVTDSTSSHTAHFKNTISKLACHISSLSSI